MKRKTFSVNSWPNAHPTCSSSSSSGRLLDKFLITSFYWQNDKEYYCLPSKALQLELYLSPLFFFTEMYFMDIKPKKCVNDLKEHYSLMYFYWDKHPYLQSDTFTSFCNIQYNSCWLWFLSSPLPVRLEMKYVQSSGNGPTTRIVFIWSEHGN